VEITSQPSLAILAQTVYLPQAIPPVIPTTTLPGKGNIPSFSPNIQDQASPEIK